MFDWLRRRRQERILRQHAIDDWLWDDTLRALDFLAYLGGPGQQRLRALCLLFLHDKSISGAAGLVIDDAIRVRIAAQACLPVLELGLDWYDDWSDIVVYPDSFMLDHEYMDEDGVVHHVREPVTGEAWEQGGVLLSWRDARDVDTGSGYNVVIHEFAHKLDMRNGPPDGFPPLHEGISRMAWTQAFEPAFADFHGRVERVESGEAADALHDKTGIDPYAAEHPAEFFAVVSETFFLIPAALRLSYPAVYEQLALFYRQNPLFPAGAGAGA